MAQVERKVEVHFVALPRSPNIECLGGVFLAGEPLKTAPLEPADVVIAAVRADLLAQLAKQTQRFSTHFDEDLQTLLVKFEGFQKAHTVFGLAEPTAHRGLRGRVRLEGTPTARDSPISTSRTRTARSEPASGTP